MLRSLFVYYTACVTKNANRKDHALFHGGIRFINIMDTGHTK